MRECPVFFDLTERAFSEPLGLFANFFPMTEKPSRLLQRRAVTVESLDKEYCRAALIQGFLFFGIPCNGNVLSQSNPAFGGDFGYPLYIFDVERRRVKFAQVLDFIA